MRAVIIEEFGQPDGMRVVETPEPGAGPGQVLVRTEAIGVGGVDAVIRRGTIGLAARAGMIPGSEVAGTVVAVGPGADAALLGRRVWAFTGLTGGYAEYAVAGTADITVLPDGLSSAEAVTLGSAAVVAHFALWRAAFAGGESVLVRGAAGSIGIAAVELAARAGASAIAVTTASPERGRRLRAHGATHVLDRAGAALDGDSGSLGDVDVIVDIVGGADTAGFVDRLGPNGRLVLVGAVAGFPPADFAQPLLTAFRHSRSVATLSLDSIPLAERGRVRAEQFGEAVRGELTPVVHDVLPLREAAEAHRRMDAGDVFGRIVLDPAQD